MPSGRLCLLAARLQLSRRLCMPATLHTHYRFLFSAVLAVLPPVLQGKRYGEINLSTTDTNVSCALNVSAAHASRLLPHHSTLLRTRHTAP